MKPSLEKKLGKVTYNEQVIELSGISDEWQPNPTWWDIKTILENDTREYDCKAIYLIKDDYKEKAISIPNASAIATSDGAFYEPNGQVITHTWDTSKDKPCLIDNIEVYKTRYIIVYTTYRFNMCYGYTGNDVLYVVAQHPENYQFMSSFEKNYNLQAIEGDIFGALSQLGDRLRYCHSLVKLPKFKNTVVGISGGFNAGESLKEVSVDITNFTSTYNLFSNCESLVDVGEMNFLKCIDARNTFYSCRQLKSVKVLNTENITKGDSMFHNCFQLELINDFDTSSMTTMGSMFSSCYNLKLAPKVNTRNATTVNSLFSSCYSIIKIYDIDLLNSTTNSAIISNCYSLRDVTFKNIKLALQIGSGNNWGYLLTLDSLLNTIKELWDNTSGTSTLTLTVSTPSKTLLQNTYVKLVDITEEMRAEDEYIDNKKPFVVCESTDEGAMTAEEYVISKNWQLA